MDGVELAFGSDEPTESVETVEPIDSTLGADSAWDDDDTKAVSDPTDDAVAAEKTAKSKEFPSEGDFEDDVSTAEPEVVETPKGKAYTFKQNGKDVALDENSVITHKVDGKLEQIPLKDLIANYAGKIPVEKRFAELDKARKQDAQRIQEFESVRTRHSSLINEMHQNVQQGKIFHAVANMLTMAGSKADPREFVRTMRAALVEQASKIAQMPEHEQALHEQKEEYEFLKAEHDRVLRTQAEQAAQAAFRERVDGAIKRVGATMEEYADAQNYAKQWYRERGKSESEIAQLVTPEAIATQIQDTRLFKTAQDSIVDVDPKLASNDKILDHLVFLQRQNPEWTKTDLVDVLRDGMGLKQSVAVSKKVTKAPVATVAKAAVKAKSAPVVQAKAKKSAALMQDPKSYGTFDDMDTEW